MKIISIRIEERINVRRWLMHKMSLDLRIDQRSQKTRVSFSQTLFVSLKAEDERTRLATFAL